MSEMLRELPPELVSLISEYSKPCFKYFREYNRLAKVCGPLPLLKEKLKDPAYLPIFLEYEEALLGWRAVKKLPATDENSAKFRRLMSAIESL
jgi:hypothetical protein